MEVDLTTRPGMGYAGPDGAGVFKTTNGGGSWSAVNTGLTETLVLVLAVDATTSPSTVYAGTFFGGGAFVFQITSTTTTSITTTTATTIPPASTTTTSTTTPSTTTTSTTTPSTTTTL